MRVCMRVTDVLCDHACWRTIVSVYVWCMQRITQRCMYVLCSFLSLRYHLVVFITSPVHCDVIYISYFMLNTSSHHRGQSCLVVKGLLSKTSLDLDSRYYHLLHHFIVFSLVEYPLLCSYGPQGTCSTIHHHYRHHKVYRPRRYNLMSPSPRSVWLKSSCSGWCVTLQWRLIPPASFGYHRYVLVCTFGVTTGSSRVRCWLYDGVLGTRDEWSRRDCQQRGSEACE